MRWPWKGFLPILSGPVHCGPVFAGSAHCKADADLISGGTLVELKTNLGTRRPGGDRYCSLPRETLYQVLCYALFDHPDEYGITRVGVYSARYGAWHVWSLGGLLSELAGCAVDVAGERDVLWRLLTCPAAAA